MTQKVYKTAMGKTVDMGALILQNETTRAVGNMKVNARGDLLGADDKVIQKKSAQIKNQAARQTSNSPVVATPKDNGPTPMPSIEIEISNIQKAPNK